MTETGDRVGPASHRPSETGDDPSAPVRQPVLRPRGTYLSKSDMVTDVLRDLITDGQLSPGTPLRQRYLAEQFEVSNTPVGEALRRLESEGLVVTDVHRGATVARTESEELEENRPQAGRPHQESVRQHDALVRALQHRNEEQVAAIIRDRVLGSIKHLPQR